MDQRPFTPPMGSPLEWGTVGWDDDGGTYYELGDGGTTETGRTLVRVQLFRGRDPTVPLDQAAAQGHKILCQIGGGFFRIPPKGTPVIVAVPQPYSDHPGACTILATSEASPSIQFSATKSKIDLGPNADLMFKARSVTFGDYSNRFVTIGPDNGIAIQDKDGTGILINGSTIVIVVPDGGDAKTVIQLSKTELDLVQKDGSLVKLHGGDIESQATNNNFVTGAGVLLGKVPTLLTPALYGEPATPAASHSVFISPT